MTKYKSLPVIKQSSKYYKNHNVDQDELIFQLKSMINTLPGDVYWKDIHGVWSGLNQHCAESLKRMGFISKANESYVVGKTDYDLFTKETADEYRKNDLEVMSNRIEITREEATQLSNGEIVTLLSKKRPFLDKNNNLIGIIGNSIDISDRKKIESELKAAQEKSEAASQAKTEFLENMRHDIRTPLTGIVGFSEILKSESNEPRIKEYADNLVASSHALLDFMDEVLEAVRVSSGEIPRLKRKFNLAKTLEQVVALYSAKAQEKKLNLSLSVDDKLPRYVIGDKIRVHRIALELIGNALNFTDSGHVTIKAELAKKEHRHLVIRIIVSDSGMGIPKDKQQEIYLQFKRLTPSYQGIYKGAGLGLYVIKQFIDELEGEIYVDSEPLKGTVFTCLIPLQEPLLDDDSGLEEPEEIRIDNPYMTPKTHQHSFMPSPSLPHDKATTVVLIVEDNYIAQTVAKTLLTQLSCAVDVASNGIDALKLCQKKHYNLIFMDIGLGEGMDGYEVTYHIRNGSNETKNTPIIALTAHGGDENKQRCIEAGMNAVLTKPLTQTHAIDILKSFIPAHYEAPADEKIKVKRDLPDNDDEMFQLNQFALLNTEEAVKNCGSQEMLKELLTLMTQELPEDLERMKKSFVAHDYTLVDKIAHKIKGGAVYVGTIRMKYACQYVERYWKSGQRELFEALYHQAVSTIEETMTYVEGWLRKNTL
ncbi:MAG: response regulator [Legionella sp.]|uniref:response regulator n=1 Tax=Legionella sp. TaxID=459 RepID=UPI0039E6F9E7